MREYRSRLGISINAEQQISATFGLFARAGLADGEVEPYEFTDVDRTLAAGLVLKGDRWGRPDDVFGLAGVVNWITGLHEAFLNAGGLGILVGDGVPAEPGDRRNPRGLLRFSHRQAARHPMKPILDELTAPHRLPRRSH